MKNNEIFSKNRAQPIFFLLLRYTEHNSQVCSMQRQATENTKNVFLVVVGFKEHMQTDDNRLQMQRAMPIEH